jgi:Asp-tRNA(Asn)/Glu-tRNA(Gln) amidotransferase B subunit
VDPDQVPAAELSRLIDARATIPRSAFDEAIAKIVEPGFSADPYLADLAISDLGEIDPVIDQILASSPGQVEAFRSGKEGLLGFFVGQVMKETKGKANPKVVSERLREKLSA